MPFFQKICEPVPPAADDPFRRIVPPEPIVHTAPELSMICVALVGTVVPSGDAVLVVPPPVVAPPPGVVLPTLSHPDPVHCHQFESVPRT